MASMSTVRMAVVLEPPPPPNQNKDNMGGGASSSSSSFDVTFSTQGLSQEHSLDASLNASLPFGLIRRCTGTMTLSVRHVHQMHAWDCGLACAWMILRSIDDVMLNGEETYTFRNQQDSSSTAVANLGGILPPPLRTTTDALAMSHLAKLVATSSVWTIDIAHVLAKFKLPVVFTTTTIGVHPGYGGEPFYRGNMHEDAKRVERLFDDAQRVGIRVVRRSLSKHDLANAILGRGAAKGVRHILIVLCDKRALRYESTATGAPTPTQHTNAQQQKTYSGSDDSSRGGLWGLCCGAETTAFSGRAHAPAPAPAPAAPTSAPSPTCAPGERATTRTSLRNAMNDTTSTTATTTIPPLPFDDVPGGGITESMADVTPTPGYMGHYIVVSDYDEQRDSFFVSDPASRGGQWHIPSTSLDNARRAFGTDEDILLVPIL
ncbi:hypothetical protein PPROV_000913500 [Pycnococcus provasolii]|uniref:Guanylyl cyclase n=1 Tax=Pycnococcus provasolii TaxID=41880 RepID=A0A830HTB6_9CHLO|nr:hypothetical protein PPROV_000913500 [Pycnococcus provasolii]